MMKNPWMYVLLALPFLYSCDDEDDGPSGSPDGIAISVNDLLGEWRITRFIDDNNDETSDLASFVLDFRQNGELVISSGSDEITSDWSLSNDGKVLTLSIEDDDAESIDPNNELEELDDDPWLITGQTDTVLDLIENDDDEPEDELSLTRI